MHGDHGFGGIAHAMSSGERLLLDGVLDYALFALDPQGCVLAWNAGAEHMYGYRAYDIVGQDFVISYMEDDVAEGRPARELEMAATRGRVQSEAWRVREDGTRFWTSTILTALRDDAGALVGFAGITRDLSDRRQAEVALQQTEEGFRLLVQTVRDYAIFMLDPTGHIATWNAGAERIKGYTADEITGQHFSIFYPPEDKRDGKPARELEIAIRTGAYQEEGWRLRKDGARFWASVVITALRNQDGSLAGFAKVTRDLTERQANQVRALEDARRVTEAETANRVKGEFLAAMSHELRTPLNAIAGYADLMLMGVSGPVTEEQRSHLQRIAKSQQHLLGIINDLLNFSRLEAGSVVFDLGSVSLHDVTIGVVPMIAPQANAKQLSVTAPCACECLAHADRSKVEQILLNLLSNAVKFTDAGGSIVVTCGSESDRVWLSVRDTGAGIPSSAIERIFSPFVQVGRTLASPKEGAGLGLSISRELARAMGGDLTVESREGVGSTFTLTLPQFSA
ncbi:MAG TPA: PAS domain-containing sensor histidine kinase [Gemmatimonadaceae bacterium]|nr:PAS domain-containing sensor histidine kinase [Gemmatimonadaceae bacterium]